jgi:aminoglycoside phosphotransferase family enzyme
MDRDPQAEVVAFLSGPDAHGGIRPELMETHVSRIFLAGELAYKLKRAVKFPYLDFATLEARHAACDEEVRINRRTAPEIYIGVQPVRRDSVGALRIDATGEGTGEVVEWLVAMNRFDQAGLFDRLAQAGELKRRRMEALADSIAAFHTEAEPNRARGGSAGTRLIVENNAASFGLAPEGVFDPDAVALLNRVSLERSRRSSRVSMRAALRGRCGTATAICTSATSAW